MRQQGLDNHQVRQPYFSPATFLVSLASVPFISSSHPPDILGRTLLFWIFLSSLISSDRKSPKALSPVVKVYQGYAIMKKNVCSGKLQSFLSCINCNASFISLALARVTGF